MKIGKLIPGTSLIILITIFSYSFQKKQTWSGGSLNIKPTPGFPEEIMKIVTNSCYDCHTGESQYETASDALDFLKWNDFEKSTKVRLLNKICSEIKEAKMPPGKYLSNNPEKKLTEDQIKTICDWADKEAEELLE